MDEKLGPLYESLKAHPSLRRQVFGIPKDRWIKNVTTDTKAATGLYDALVDAGEIKESSLNDFLGKIGHGAVVAPAVDPPTKILLPTPRPAGDPAMDALDPSLTQHAPSAVQEKPGIIQTFKDTWGGTKQFVEPLIQHGKDIAKGIQRGWAQGEAIQKAPLTDLATGSEKVDFKGIAEANRKVKDMGQTGAEADFATSTGPMDDITDYAKMVLPVVSESIATLIRSGAEEAGVGAATGAGLGSVVPGVGTVAGAGTGAAAGMAQAGYNMELYASIMDGLEEKGIDTGDEAQLKAAFADKSLMEPILSKANKRAAIIAGVDLVGGAAANSAGRALRAVEHVSPLGKILSRTAKIAGKADDALTGGTGEAAAQLATEGKINPQEVALEALGEAPIAGAIRTGLGVGSQPPAQLGGIPTQPADPNDPQFVEAEDVDGNGRKMVRVDSKDKIPPNAQSVTEFSDKAGNKTYAYFEPIETINIDASETTAPQSEGAVGGDVNPDMGIPGLAENQDVVEGEIPVTEENRAVEEAAPNEPMQHGQKVSGTFYRADSGFVNDREKTAQDVLDYEADENENEDAQIAREKIKESGIDLSGVSNREIVWVTRDRESAARYGDDVENLDISDATVIIPDDGDGGMLLLLNRKPNESPPPTPLPQPTNAGPTPSAPETEPNGTAGVSAEVVAEEPIVDTGVQSEAGGSEAPGGLKTQAQFVSEGIEKREQILKSEKERIEKAISDKKEGKITPKEATRTINDAKHQMHLAHREIEGSNSYIKNHHKDLVAGMLNPVYDYSGDPIGYNDNGPIYPEIATSGYAKAISEGRITSEKAAEIIKSTGLEVPPDIRPLPPNEPPPPTPLPQQTNPEPAGTDGVSAEVVAQEPIVDSEGVEGDGGVAKSDETETIQQGYARKAISDFLKNGGSYQINEGADGVTLSLSEKQVRSANGFKGGESIIPHPDANIEFTKEELKELRQIEADKKLGDIDGLEYAKRKRELANKIFSRALQEKSSTQPTPKTPPIKESAETKLKSAFNKWKSGEQNLGAVFDPKSGYARDKELLKAIIQYAKDKAIQTYDAFKAMLEENGVYDASKDKDWREVYDGVVGPPTSEQPPGQKQSESGETKKSRLAERAVEGDNSEDFNDRMEELGYSYEVANRKRSGEIAKKLIADYGWEKVLEGIRTGQITGAPATRAFGDIIDILGAKLNDAKTPEEFEEALAEQAKLVREFSLRQTELGQGAQATYDVYLENDFKFNLASMVEGYRAAGGVMDAETMAKFKGLEQEIKDLTKKLEENEEARQKAEEALVLNAYTESTERQDKGAPKTSKAIRDLADRIEKKMKLSRPEFINSSSPGALAWDAAVDALVLAMRGTATVAEAVEIGLKKFRESEWYKSVSKETQKKAEDAFALQYAESKAPEPEYIDNKVKVTRGGIAALVRQGYNTIDKLTDKVHEMLGQPELTKRQVRDAITKYGKTINQSKDEIQKKVREITRIGRLVSQLEDARRKIRPLKSGLQRDKLVEEERRLQRLLNDALKELPPTDADLSKAIKTALDGVKSRLKNQIEDLNAQIAKKERIARSQKKTAYDAEATALKEQRDTLQATLDDLVGKAEITDEQKIKNALEAVEKSLAEYQRRIDQKDFSSFQKEPGPENEELKKARAERDKLKEEYELLKNGPPKTKEQIANETAIRNAEASIEELDRRIKEKDFSTKEKGSIPESEELKTLRAIKEAKEKELANLKKEAFPPKSPEQLKLDRLQAQLDNLLQGQIPDSKDKVADSPEAKALKDQIQKAKEALGLVAAKRTQDEIAYDNTLKATKKRLEETERRVAQKELDEAGKKAKQFGPELDALRKRQKEAQEALEALKKEAGIIEAEKLAQYKTRAQEAIDEYNRRIKEGDFSAKEKDPLAKLDAEALKLRAEKIRAKEDYLKALEHARKGQEKWHTNFVYNVARSMQAILATGEASFIGIQNAMLVARKILFNRKGSAQDFKDMFFSTISPKYSKELIQTIKAQPWYHELKESGLTLIDDFLPENLQNEMVHIPLSEKIWKIVEYPARLLTFGDMPWQVKKDLVGDLWKRGNALEAIERASNAFGNNIRVAEFMRGRDMLLKKGITFEDNPEAYKELATGINTMTARTRLGKGEHITKWLNLLFFSARNWASVLKQLPPLSFYHFGKMTQGADRARVTIKPQTIKIAGKSIKIPGRSFSVPKEASPIQKMYMQNFMSWFALTAGLVGTAALISHAGDDDDKDERPIVELDPTSAAAGKVRFGDQYFDPWGGRQQQVVFMARIIADILMYYGLTDHSYKTMLSGEEKTLGESMYVPTKGELALNMMRNKASPAAGMFYDWMGSVYDADKDERTLNGRELDLMENYKDTFIPMYWPSVVETAKEQPALTAMFLSGLGSIGMSTQTIKPAEKTTAQSLEETLHPGKAEQDQAKSRLKKAIESLDVNNAKRNLEASGVSLHDLAKEIADEQGPLLKGEKPYVKRTIEGAALDPTRDDTVYTKEAGVIPVKEKLTTYLPIVRIEAEKLKNKKKSALRFLNKIKPKDDLTDYQLYYRE